ncbi:hypothetical protein D3C76_1013620 [compost metagenome]
MFFVYQQLQLTFTSHGLSEIQTAEFILMRNRRHLTFRYDPIIKWALIFKLKRTKGVSYTFNGVLKWMSERVHRVDAPFIPCIMVMRMSNPIDDRITQINIW